MPPRARPLSPDDRLDQLVDVTLLLLREHGRAVTTKQIAEAAGVAEGTIFRVVDTKEELVDRAISRAFTPGAVVERLEEIDPTKPLRQRLVLMTSILQQRYRATFDLMRKVGLVKPPVHDSPEAELWRARLAELMVRVVGRDAERLTVPPQEFCHRLRLLAFAGAHPHISDGHYLEAEAVVDTVLGGLLAPFARSETVAITQDAACS
ncbi:TetR/AcrR family transcriptional regulator [Nocardioides acrostichi]|uniref:TetR/AcrR family transcriptional regulator n=1 Tax=Nocardioides acrostichi TaxID=2784339 RepID=A0A930Y7W6_9ACTN|nr:TetR/AcrR family transcriptional regulator [Nocardioides acrostichi]MBF4162426.1 TetR/AcrR family transcriptional regulator [Nocardioides acrostichi]